MQEDFLQGRVGLGFPREVRIFNTEAAALPARNLLATLHKMENEIYVIPKYNQYGNTGYEEVTGGIQKKNDLIVFYLELEFWFLVCSCQSILPSVNSHFCPSVPTDCRRNLFCLIHFTL